MATARFSLFLLLAASFGAALLPPNTAHAETASDWFPRGNHVLDFSILRNDSQVGTYQILLRRLGEGQIEARGEADVTVTLGPITLYHFHQLAVETWKNGQLIGLISDTSEDNEKNHVTGSAANGALALTVDGKPLKLAADAVPLSLWHKEMATGRPIFDLQDGQPVAGEGTCEPTAPHAGAPAGSECQISGETSRRLQYDSQGLLEEASFTNDDGSRIRYRRR